MPNYELTTIAETGDRFCDFAPYVASISDGGDVAFWAATTDGRDGIFVALARGGDPVAVASTERGELSGFVSHPDIDRDGAVTFYATRGDGNQAVFLVRDGQTAAVADTRAGFAHIGPLGPTMDCGTVAFRATAADGVERLFVYRAGALETVASIGREYARFEGLPVVTAAGVVFRADRRDRGPAICRYADGAVSVLVDTRDRFADLGRFPTACDDGAIAFQATARDGGQGVFILRDGRLATVADTRAAFDSFRGILINRAGVVVFYATPSGGELAIFSGPHPSDDRILGIGDAQLGSAVTAFALNPVSANEAGQLAVRVELADDRQAILRADPSR